MGTQGEIYTVLGLKLPAKIIEKDKLYEVNGKTVSADESNETLTDLINVIPTEPIDLTTPNLVVRILGHNNADWLKGRHFEGEALIGYVIANESYIDRATELPPHRSIEKLKPLLIKDIKKKFGYKARIDELKIYLLFDSINGF